MPLRDIRSGIFVFAVKISGYIRLSAGLIDDIYHA